MEERVALVTGAYGSIGNAIACGLARLPDMKVVLLGRDKEKLEQASLSIKNNTGNPSVETEVVDVSSKHQIISLKNRWQGPLHILVNNAATTPRERTLSSDGVEMQWATNVMGYFWMMYYMKEHLKYQKDSRIVNVASYWAGGLDLDDVEFSKRTYNNDTAYRQSKQANRMLSVFFSKQSKAFKISVNACHPGDVNSKLSNALGFGGHESAEQAAETPLWLATNAGLQGTSGNYYEHRLPKKCQFADDRYKIQSLYNLCMDYTV